MRIALLMTLTLMSAVAVAGQAAGPVAIDVGDQEISAEEFLLYLKVSRPGIEFERLPEAEQRRLIDEVVERKLYALAAREAGLDRVAAVRTRVDFFTDGVLAQEFKRGLQREFVPTDDEILAYYLEHGAQFTAAPRVLLEHLIYPDADAARQARLALIEGESHEQLARDRRPGRGPSWVERGWREPSLLLPELSAPAFALEAGQVAEIVETSYGHHLLRVQEHEPARLKPLEEVRAEVVTRLRQAASAQRYAETLERLRSRHRVRVQHEAGDASE